MHNGMTKENKEVKIRLLYVVIPVLIGIGVVVWLFWDEFGNFDWNSISFTPVMALWLVLAVVAVAGREVGYM